MVVEADDRARTAFVGAAAAALVSRAVVLTSDRDWSPIFPLAMLAGSCVLAVDATWFACLSSSDSPIVASGIAVVR